MVNILLEDPRELIVPPPPPEGKAIWLVQVGEGVAILYIKNRALEVLGTITQEGLLSNIHCENGGGEGKEKKHFLPTLEPGKFQVKLNLHQYSKDGVFIEIAGIVCFRFEIEKHQFNFSTGTGDGMKDAGFPINGHCYFMYRRID